MEEHTEVSARALPFGREDDAQDLEVLTASRGRGAPEPPPWLIEVPMFGILAVGRSDPFPKLTRPGSPLKGLPRATVFTPPHTGGRSVPAIEEDGVVRVELLPNVSGEDRIVVEIRNLP